MFRNGGPLSRYALPVAVILLSALAGLMIPLVSGRQPRGSKTPWVPPTLTVTPTSSPAATRRVISATAEAQTATQAWTAQPTATTAPTATLEAATPTVTPTATVVVSAEVTGDGLSLRAGPAMGQPLVGTAKIGDRFTVVARSADAKWLQVCCLNEQQVWLSAAYVKLDASLDSVPVAP